MREDVFSRAAVVLGSGHRYLIHGSMVASRNNSHVPASSEK